MASNPQQHAQAARAHAQAAQQNQTLAQQHARAGRHSLAQAHAQSAQAHARAAQTRAKQAQQGAAQQNILKTKSGQLAKAQPYFNPQISRFYPPTDSQMFVVTPASGNAAQPFVAYPAPGAGPTTVISFTVPVGQMAVINKICIVHVGGNPPDGTGNVIWRVKKNGAGIRGLNNLNAQIGTWAQPNDAVITAIENDTVIVTVEVPAGQPAMPAGTGTAARFHGYTLPLLRATDKSTQQV